MTAVLLALGAAVGWGVLVPLIAVRGDGPPSTLRIVYAVLAGITDVAGISALYRGLSVGTRLLRRGRGWRSLLERRSSCDWSERRSRSCCSLPSFTPRAVGISTG